jgi:hypothetical protein
MQKNEPIIIKSTSFIPKESKSTKELTLPNTLKTQKTFILKKSTYEKDYFNILPSYFFNSLECPK